MTALGGEDLIVIDSSESAADRLREKAVVMERKSLGEYYLGFLQQIRTDKRSVPVLVESKLNEFAKFLRVKEHDIAAEKIEGSRKRNRNAAENGLLPVQGMFQPVTPITDWKVLGRVICWISYEKYGGLSPLTSAGNGQLEKKHS
jgi:hypothetical protein